MDAQLYGRQSSTRWIPTPEQIRILKDLYYNQGVRSPTSEQIQRISSKLRQYGKIEGKNVFYWFQNHKARERQKMKLAMEISNSNSTLTNLNDAYGFAADNSPVFLERSITEACFNGANGVEWEGCIIEHDVTMPWMYSYIQDDHNQFVSQSTRNIETLPLFPTHSQEEEEEEEEEEEKFGVAVPQSNYSNNNECNYYMQPNNGYNMPAYCYNGNGADSLELTLNSYYCNRS